MFSAFMTQFTVAAAYNITYAPYVSDYSRYMPRKTSPGASSPPCSSAPRASAIWLIALGAWLGEQARRHRRTASACRPSVTT